jgi:hypothetical protein
MKARGDRRLLVAGTRQIAQKEGSHSPRHGSVHRRVGTFHTLVSVFYLIVCADKLLMLSSAGNRQVDRESKKQMILFRHNGGWGGLWLCLLSIPCFAGSAAADSKVQFAVAVPHAWRYAVRIPTAVSMSFHAARVRLPAAATMTVRSAKTTIT